MTEKAATSDALRVLVEACEAAFIGDGGSLDVFEDDDDVTTPASGITFGMVRRAREALDGYVALTQLARAVAAEPQAPGRLSRLKELLDA